MNRLPEAFSKNRSEEAKEDKWCDFVVPPFIHELGIRSQSKALVIVGGRGCGKTTLLRYFCHATQFSPRKYELTTTDLSHIGLYWRADTNFLNAFVGGGESEETWRSAFQHLLACELSSEILRALRSINCNESRIRSYGRLEDLKFEALGGFGEDYSGSLSQLEVSLKRARIELGMWINNLGDYPKPRFLPDVLFIKSLIDCLTDQLPYLSTSTFGVFIDEYENLREEQQSHINGLLKHGEKPLIFNIAMKRNGWHTTKTIGPESIEDISDFRKIDLEEKLSEDFELFAAELLFYRLIQHDETLLDRVPIDPNTLQDLGMVKDRYENSNYRETVVQAASNMLPRLSPQEAAQYIFETPMLKKALASSIEKGLKNRGSHLEVSQFLDERVPSSSLLMYALLHREREDPEELLRELKDSAEGKENRLSKGDLVNNNLFGCANAVFLDARKPSLLFSGFASLALMSRGNVRHFIELVHRVFLAVDSVTEQALPVISVDVQAVAVKQASESILANVKGHGRYGPQLYALAMTLGSLFREFHRDSRQSEPEKNHFTLSGGELSDQLRRYLSEAEKWSVLFIDPETKMKSSGAIESDYVLNPIFAPYFQISFRKKRSIELTTDQLLKMLEGDQKARDELVRSYQRHVMHQEDLFSGN